MLKRAEVPTLSIIGLLALSIIFGWFRYGYGLMFPEFRSAYNLSASILGVISSLTFITFLVGALTVVILVSKLGSRPMILTGIFTASTGLLVAAFTINWLIFAAACLFAGLSPGLTWSSFSKSVNQHVHQHLQKRSLAIISTGSTVGLMLISGLYLSLNGEWRFIWGGGAIIGYLLLVWAYKSVPSKEEGKGGPAITYADLCPLFTKFCLPFYVASFLFGVTEATYWTFAADFVQESFAIPNANAIFFLITGIGGLAGLLAGDVISKLGMKMSFILTILLYSISIAALYLVQGWLLVCISGLLFGVSFMLYAAYLPIWSAQVFPDVPAQGFGICIIILNIGAIIGPAMFGWIMAYAAYDVIFLIAGIIACLKVFTLPVKSEAY